MRAVALAVALAAMPWLVQAADESTSEADAIDWLLKVSEAARHASYQGVVVYRDDQVMETMRIVHRHKDGREQERLTSLNGPARDIFREDDHVTCILSEAHGHDVASSSATKAPRIFPSMSRETLTAVAPHYRFQDMGTAAVAGHECRGVAVVPRDGFRYGYRIWADARTNVPLKVSLTGPQGRVIEEMMFTRVEFPERIDDAALAIPPGRKGVSPPATEPVEAASGPPRWMPRRLPPGFRFTMRSVKPSPDGSGLVEHVLLSDGLSAVSVFSSRMPESQEPFRGQSRMGGINVYGRMLGRVYFTVVGEVPPSTVRYIGDSLEAAEPATETAGETAP